ncbi:MAG: glycoside hydrolase family 16 protein, partial [Leeuwenhoekiella sp.]
AIWTLGIEKGWPSNGEIDIMEFYLVNHKPAILANAAWKGDTTHVNWDSEKIPFSKFVEKDPDWPNKFHIWKMDWTEDYIKIYLDGDLLNEIDLNEAKNPDGFNPFHQPHYILLNLAIGGNGGDPSKTSFPKKYQVDYVRVFQKK